MEVIAGRFLEECRERGLKVNVGKSKVMVLDKEEGLECEICVAGTQLEKMSEFKYLGCVLIDSGTDVVKLCCRKVVSGRKVVGVIKSQVNARYLQFECARVLYQAFLLSVLLYGSETMIWKEKEISRIKAVQMNNLKGLLHIRRMDEVPNVGI